MFRKITSVVSKFTNTPSLVQGHDYHLIGIDDTHYRIIDESGDPVLYPKNYFLDEDVSPPEEWVFRDYGDGEYVYLVPALSARGFYEDYADGVQEVVEIFQDFRRSLE
ncbi:hypothetical protein NZK35_09100 [Stieleria sp. ICT_E10.1]|uniref:hypothetical protein n=1 Tax=Stieleria sedimenti TaxID=2976331 RepID=UPI0021807C95|nr:hypothetical protein [Stieleria sedimenti]MCS7466798.1 hypothetical protein [Stieleria sedimenti]